MALRAAILFLVLGATSLLCLAQQSTSEQIEEAGLAAWLADNYLTSLEFEITEIEMSPSSLRQDEFSSGWITIRNTSDIIAQTNGWYLELSSTGKVVQRTKPLPKWSSINPGGNVQVPLPATPTVAIDAISLIGAIVVDGNIVSTAVITETTRHDEGVEVGFEDTHADCRTWRRAHETEIADWIFDYDIEDDLFSPTISQHESMEITCPPCANSAIVIYEIPSFVDDSPGASISRIAGLGSGAIFPIGTTTETYVVEDVAGNQVTSSFDITIVGSACELSVAITDARPIRLPANNLDKRDWRFYAKYQDRQIRFSPDSDFPIQVAQVENTKTTIHIIIAITENDIAQVDAGFVLLSIEPVGEAHEAVHVQVVVEGYGVGETENGVWEFTLQIDRE